ncbi:signal transduction histidine-protein kinase BarA [Janthinobacterium sp. HH107]|uniref:response regulator n=1 Tax=Janthinobacterium sp. HH107 TaxID=1537279 RepID=UPI00087596BD|nr:response regulator [Janthinobacterium sp. HH107]OEZ90451.1 signal transduction histidine-protein kinase BarA [Janthinobacterium sp. HH107]
MTYHTDAAAVRRQWIEWLFLLLGLLIVAAALAYAHLAEATRHDAAERERLSVLTALLAKNIEVDLEATNLVLGGVIRDYLAAGTAPDAGQALPRRLAALVDAMPGVRTMLVIDAQGKPVATNIAELADQDFSRRGYFQTARDAPDARMLYISAPFHTFKGDLVITASRMVQDKQGRFAGVVVATFAPEYFTAKFRTAMYAPDVWAVVLHGDGRQFLNYPARTANGANMDVPGSFLRRFRDSGYQAGVLSGVDIAGAPAAPRVMAMATIAPPALHMDRALIIGLSREEAAIAAPLQRQALGYVLSFAVLALAAASLLFWSQRRRRQQAAWHAEQETERQAMQAVSDSETRFRTLIEDAPVAIAILRHGRFIYSNPRYRRLHGYTADDNLNGLPWSAMISAPSLAALAANEALIEADSPSEQVFEAVGLGKQGLPVPMYKTTTRVVLKDGPATLIFAQDISTQKQAEEAMLLARDAAESANRSKAEFLANMSHEIRSPLNAILGMAWLLERDGLDGEALLMARKIRAAGQSLLGIINDVLDVSKIEAGHMTIERAPFRLADVIEKIAVSMGVAAHDKPIEVRIGPLPDGVEQVMGDALRLEQVLVNLTSNAIKFTAQGAVELTSALESRDGDAAVLCFSVRDTGIGIAPEVQEAIFSAFAQADSSTTRRFGGTGLGLTICRQLVRLMGGAMRLTSVMGQGSTFSFTVPLQLMPASAPSSPDMQGLRVLLADGKADSRAAVAAVAQGLGWRVHAVSGGQAALEHALACAEEARPGVIVLAARMPDMDGETTARALREHLPPQDCPIVILAASGAPATAPARRHTDPANPADAILNEPVTASSLYNATMEARQRRAEAAGLDTGHAALGARVLAGVRVLVVDDSDINRDVVNHILCDQGALPSFACDGQQALDWLLAHPSDVDIVLMDVQMPVMDGLQATRALRQLPQFQDLPVVALTAGAFRTQRTAALEAGVNHFISKPFDVPQTIALIASAHRRHAQGLPALPPAATEAAAPSRAGGAAPVIDLAQGMAQWLDEAPYRQHLSHFGNTYRNTVGAMRALLAANARGDAAALAHKLAGVAGSLALPATLQAAQQAEQLLHAGGDASAALDALEQALAHAIDAVAAFTAQTPAPGQPAMPETQHGSACQ